MRRRSQILRVALGAFLALVIVIVLLRLALPHWDGLHAWVETTASEQLEREVTAAGIELGWTGWSPALVARDVRVAMPDGEPVAMTTSGSR